MEHMGTSSAALTGSNSFQCVSRPETKRFIAAREFCVGKKYARFGAVRSQ
jgi:hypothetical protein